MIRQHIFINQKCIRILPRVIKYKIPAVLWCKWGSIDMLDLVVTGRIIISRQWLLSYRYADMQWVFGRPQSWVIAHLCTKHKDCPTGAIYLCTTDIDTYAETLKFLRFYGRYLDKLNLVVNRRTKAITGYHYGMDVQWVFEHSLTFVPRRSTLSPTMPATIPKPLSGEHRSVWKRKCVEVHGKCCT